jgi:perosamine synthetase
MFERAIADFTSARHAIAVNNGTISLTLALIAVGVKAGDEVIVPNFTMIATPNSAKMIGAEPIFVDVQEETLCLDINLVEQAITKRTKAVILVSANGRVPTYNITDLKQLCQAHGLALVEDAAQSLGSWYAPGRHVGLEGSVGSLSFSAPKIITTGQGGMLLTNDDDVASRLRRLKDFGRAGGGNDIHDTIGFNSKFTELQALIGIEQTKKLPWRVDRKKAIWRRYRDRLSDVSEVRVFSHNLDLQVPWFIDVLAENRTHLVAELAAQEIKTRTMYPPINAQKAYQKPGSYPVSEMVGRSGLWLPSFTQLTDDEIDVVCTAVRKFYGYGGV